MTVRRPEHSTAGQDHAAMMSDRSMAKAMEADMRRRFWLALVLTIPLAIMAGHVPGLPMLIHPPVASWIGLALSTPVVFWSGWIFIAGAANALRNRKLDMSVPMAAGVLGAYLTTVYLTITRYPVAYYEAAAMLVTFVFFGHWMGMKPRRGTSDALHALLDLVPPRARVVREGREEMVPTDAVAVGDVLRILPGEKIPVGGELTEGETDVDEALITGESNPVHKRAGDAVIGGAINVSGAVLARATKVGSDTVLAQIASLVERAQNSKAPGQRLADRAAAVLVVVAVGAGVATFVGWKFFAHAPFLTALTFAISAIVIACPDALGLATPTAVAVGTGLAAKHSILIKDAATLEGMSRIQTIVLDKTGTLTVGSPTVTDIQPTAGARPEDMLAIAASVSSSSTHPLSAAVVRAANDRKLTVAKATDIENIPGKGVRGRLDGDEVLVGNAALLNDKGVAFATVNEVAARLTAAGQSVVFVARAGAVLGVLGIADAVRPSSRAAIEELKAMGTEPVLISGDAKATAERVAHEVGIEKVFAEVRPEEKAVHVQRLQKEGRVVAMVGDGINDAPALAQADIGIAIGAGTDVAAQAARVVLMRSDPADIAKAIRLSKATVRKMKQNLVWASAYNLLAIPVAAGAFYHSLGWSIQPAVSALLMSMSSIVVALNAVSLRRARI